MMEDAFPVHPLDPRGAFVEWGSRFLYADQFAVESKKRLWTALSQTFLEHHHDAIAFLGPASFAQYLPAFLNAVVHQTESIDVMPVSLLSQLTRRRCDAHSQTKFDERLKHLTKPQQLAVAKALAFLEQPHGCRLDERMATEALNSYWRKLLNR